MKAIHAEFRRALARGACVRELRHRGYRIGLSDVGGSYGSTGSGRRKRRLIIRGGSELQARLPVGDNMLNRRFSRPAPTTVRSGDDITHSQTG